MRNAFASEITKLAALDQRIVILSGDIGNKLFDNYKSLFPKRFYNCGVAEANMTGIAAGMAQCGLRPITYTITPFNTTRCLEQIKIDICYHKLPVIVVGVGAGLSYGKLGGSHQSCEDISFLRTIPNMTVLCPADSNELRVLLRKAIQYNNPVYLRIGMKGEPLIHKDEPDIQIGKAYIVKDGKDICLISTGNMVAETIKTAELLEKDDISCRVVSLHTIKPIDKEFLEKVFQEFSLIVSVEEHSYLGGLSSAISEWMTDNQISSSLLKIAVPDSFFKLVGSQKYLREKVGLEANQMYEKIKEQLRIRKSENISSNIS